MTAINFALIVFSTVFLVLISLLPCFFMLRKYWRGQRVVIQNQLYIANHSAISMGQRIIELEKNLNNLRAEAAAANNQSNRDFVRAKQLLSAGLTERSIATSSGLSEGDVQLMQLLQSKKSAAKADALNRPTKAS